MPPQRRILQRQPLGSRRTATYRYTTTTTQRPSQSDTLSARSEINLSQYVNNPNYTVTRNNQGVITKIEAKPVQYIKVKDIKNDKRKYGRYIPEVITFNNSGIPIKRITTKPYVSDQTSRGKKYSLYNPVVIKYDSEGYRKSFVYRDAERKSKDSSERKIIIEKKKVYDKGVVTRSESFTRPSIYAKPVKVQPKPSPVNIKDSEGNRVLGVTTPNADGGTTTVSRLGKVTVRNSKGRITEQFYTTSQSTKTYLKEQSKRIISESAQQNKLKSNFDRLKKIFEKQGYVVEKQRGTGNLIAYKGGFKDGQRVIVKTDNLAFISTPTSAKISKSTLANLGTYWGYGERIGRKQRIKDERAYKKAVKEYKKAIETQKLMDDTYNRIMNPKDAVGKLAIRQQNVEKNYEEGVQRYLDAIGIGRQDPSRAKLTKSQLLNVGISLTLLSNPVTNKLGNEYLNKYVPKEWRNEFTKSILRLPFDAVIGLPLTIGGRIGLSSAYLGKSIIKKQVPTALKVGGNEYKNEIIRMFDIRTPDGIINLAFTVASIRSIAKSKVGEIPKKATGKIAKLLKNTKIEKAYIEIAKFGRNKLKITKTGLARIGKELIPFKETRYVKNNLVKLSDIQGRSTLIRKTPLQKITYPLNKVLRDVSKGIKESPTVVKTIEIIKTIKSDIKTKFNKLTSSRLDLLYKKRSLLQKYIMDLESYRKKIMNETGKSGQKMRSELVKEIKGYEKQLKTLDTKINVLISKKKPSLLIRAKKFIKSLKSDIKTKFKKLTESKLTKLLKKRSLLQKYIMDLESYRRKIVNDTSKTGQKMRSELVKEVKGYEKELKTLDTKINKIISKQKAKKTKGKKVKFTKPSLRLTKRERLRVLSREINKKGLSTVLSKPYRNLALRVKKYLAMRKARKLNTQGKVNQVVNKAVTEIEILKTPEFYELAYKKLARKKGLKSKSMIPKEVNKLIKDIEILKTPEYYDLAYKKLMRKKSRKTKGGVTKEQMQNLIKQVKIAKKPSKPITREIKTKEGLILEQVVEQKVKKVTKTKPEKVIVLMSQEQFNLFKKLIDKGIKEKTAQIKRTKSLQRQKLLQKQKKKLETTKKQATRSVSKQVSKLKSKSGYTTKTSAIVYPIVKLDWSSLSAVLQIPRLKIFQKGMQIPKSRIAQKQKQLQKQDLKQLQDEIQKQRLLRKQRIITKPKQRTLQKPKTVTELRRLQRLKRLRKQKQKPVKADIDFEEYAKNKPIDVYVKKSGAKSRYVKVNARPLTLTSAKNYGRYIVDNLPLASYRLVVSKSKAKKMGFKTKTPGRKFRERKGKTKLPSKTMVEKSRYRLDRNPEKKGITLKGLQKLQSQRAIINAIKKAGKRKKR